MKLSDYIASFLIAKGCKYVFGYQGGAVTHLVDSIYSYPDIKFISTCHEQAAAFAAEGYARAAKGAGGLGVAIATSGPGATNLITGIASAYFDSIPCLYLTGQVNTYEYKGDAPVRQMGFQETDIVEIVKPVTKYAVRITDPEHIRHTLEKAVHIALDGRKGPVLIDIPMDIQRAEIDTTTLKAFKPDYPHNASCNISKVIRLLNASKRPVLLAGGGVRLSGACDALEKVANALRIPVVSSLMGKDAFDNSSNLYAGMLGAYGNRYANLTVANCDLIFALGTRLDSRQVGTKPETFARAAKVIRVDIDDAELSRSIKDDEWKIHADVLWFLTKLLDSRKQIQTDTSDWLSRITSYKQRYRSYSTRSFGDPNFLMVKFSRLMGKNDVVCLDVGQNQMWAAQSLCIAQGRRLLTSGGMGAMGFSIPCAVGAYYGGTSGTVYAFCGDGGAQMNIQELEVIRRNNIPVKIIVLNNRSLGMIRHFQEMYFDRRYHATMADYSAPDFCKLAAIYGIKSCRIQRMSGFAQAKELLADNGPALIEVMLPQTTYVFPKLAVNRPIEDQEPRLSREELLMNMHVEMYCPAELDADQYRLFIRQTFDSYKCKGNLDTLRLLPIVKPDGTRAGYLRPITTAYKTELPGCGARLARWRNLFPEMTATRFHATQQSTEEWLDRLVLDRDDRILFLIVPGDPADAGEDDNAFRGVGHIGLSSFDYEQRSCEIDAVIRGESAYPGIMSLALGTLVKWCIHQLGILSPGLRVMQTNQKAIDFYIKNGFVPHETKIQSEYLFMHLNA